VIAWGLSIELEMRGDYRKDFEMATKLWEDGRRAVSLSQEIFNYLTIEMAKEGVEPKDFLQWINTKDGEYSIIEACKSISRKCKEARQPLLLRLITAVKFNHVSPNITPENFPEELIRSEDYCVYHFGRDISSEEAIAKIIKDGYLPANIYEFLKWDGWNGEDLVVALGSSCVVDDYRRVPCRHCFGTERNLSLRHWDGDWLGNFRFLAVRLPAQAGNPQLLVS
jgi:hypothetical protein